MTLFVTQCAITVWAVAMATICLGCLRTVVAARGWELFDGLLVIAGVGAPALAAYCWLFGVQ